MIKSAIAIILIGFMTSKLYELDDQDWKLVKDALPNKDVRVRDRPLPEHEFSFSLSEGEQQELDQRIENGKEVNKRVMIFELDFKKENCLAGLKPIDYLEANSVKASFHLPQVEALKNKSLNNNNDLIFQLIKEYENQESFEIPVTKKDQETQARLKVAENCVKREIAHFKVDLQDLIKMREVFIRQLQKRGYKCDFLKGFKGYEHSLLDENLLCSLGKEQSMFKITFYFSPTDNLSKTFSVQALQYVKCDEEIQKAFDDSSYKGYIYCSKDGIDQNSYLIVDNDKLVKHLQQETYEITCMDTNDDMDLKDFAERIFNQAVIKSTSNSWQLEELFI